MGPGHTIESFDKSYYRTFDLKKKKVKMMVRNELENLLRTTLAKLIDYTPRAPPPSPRLLFS